MDPQDVKPHDEEPRPKPRLATVWLGGCSGCHMSLLDLDERLIELQRRVELCRSPLVDAKDFPPVDIALVEGAVVNEDNLRELRRVRAQSKTVVAFGDCAVTGNVSAMRNQFGLEDVLDAAYRRSSQVVRGVPRGGDGIVPALLPKVVPIHAVVHVDHFLPGCPPSADAIWEVLTALLDGRPPALVGRFG